MEKEVEISVIIPVYNLENWIERCVTSIMEQTFQEYEVIIIDDGSTDESEKKLLSLKAQYNDKIHVCFQKNAGQANARNNGLRIAKGKYVVFIDGDDYVSSDFLEKLYNKIHSENLDCVVCGYERVDEKGNVIQTIKPNIKNDLYQIRYMTVWNKIFRREYLIDNHIYFPEGKLYEDVLVSWLTYFCSDKIGVIDDVGYKYMLRKGSSSNSRISLEKIPFEENEQALVQLLAKNLTTERKNILEYSVLSQFTFFIFCLARRNAVSTVTVLVKKFSDILNRHFPGYYKNPLIKSHEIKSSIPLSQRVGIRIFSFACRFRILQIFAIIATRF